MRRSPGRTDVTVLAALAVISVAALGGCRRIEQRDPSGAITVDTVARWWGDYVRDLRGDDPAAVARWFTDSALLMEPGSADVAGRAAIERLFREGLAANQIEDVRIQPREMTAAGARMFEWGTFVERYRPRGGATMERRGRYMAEWRRPRGEGEQAWRIHRLMLSDGLPADGAAALAP